MSDIRKIDEIIKMVNHPLEDHFDIEKGSTELVITERNTELEKYESYDNKDSEIEIGYQEIADKALDMVDLIKNQLPTAEPKFLARLTEVAGQQLNVALSAINHKAKLKTQKDNLEFRKNSKSPTGSTTINNTIHMDRNELIRTLSNSINENGVVLDITPENKND